jgi:hypothetical protein
MRGRSQNTVEMSPVETDGTENGLSYTVGWTV